MQKGTTVFIKLRRTLAPAMRQILEHVGPLRYVGVKMMSLYLKPTVQLDGHTVSVDPVDFGVSFELESTGEYEAASMAYCKSVLKPGMTFVDVGANIGLFSLMAARQVGPTGKVYAFEPGADNCTLLRKNIEQNGYRNVTIVEKAVSEKPGPATRSQPGFNTAAPRFYNLSKRNHRGYDQNGYRRSGRIWYPRHEAHPEREPRRKIHCGMLAGDAPKGG